VKNKKNYINKKALSCAEPRHLIWRIKRKNRSNGLACRRVEEPKKVW